jgi:D-alanyl-D-alanine endopeptidase (penicillin-binding protein 7)
MSRLWSTAALSFLCTTGLVLIGAAQRGAPAAPLAPLAPLGSAAPVAQAVAPSPIRAVPAVAPQRVDPQAPQQIVTKVASNTLASPALISVAAPSADAQPAAPVRSARAKTGPSALSRAWSALAEGLWAEAPPQPWPGTGLYQEDHPSSVPALAHSGLDQALSPPPRSKTFEPPSWFPAEQRLALTMLDDISGAPARTDASLQLHSRAVFVWDLDANRALLARRADDRRPVASLTKVMSALTTVAEGADLDAQVCLDLSSRPSWPGAVSRIRKGTCTTGWDLLGAALVRSDNGAAYALPEVSGLPHYVFVARMNAVSRELGMDQSTWSDPSGAEDDNISTARDMTRAIIAASLHPELGPVASAPAWSLEDQTEGKTRQLITTNSLIGRPDTDILAAKTGYTDTARYCFTGVFRLSNGRTVAVTTLGAGRNRDRWADLRAILAWAESERPDAG